MAIAARFSFKSPGTGPKGAPLPRRFPDSVDWTPKRRCCDDGAGGLCEPRPGYWLNPTWKALRFTLPEPHRFQYRFVVNKGASGEGPAFEAQARGDVDCSGRSVVFTLRGQAGKDGHVTLSPMSHSLSPTEEKR